MESKSSPLRAAVYVRQSVREDQGIKQQIEACTARLEAEGWTQAGIYDDNDTSATKERAEGTDWARLMSDIDAGQVDVVISVTVARLLRRVSDVLRLTERNIRVVTCRDGIDTGSAFGKAVLTILVALAEAEIQEKEARALPYRAARRAFGHPTAGRVPYGYRWIPKSHRDESETRFEIVPDEASALRFMFAEAIAGASIASICRELNNGTARLDGKPLPIQTKRTRQGTLWGTSSVRRLLISPFPAALLPPKMPEDQPYRAEAFDLSECTPGAWEAIVTTDQVAAIRHLLLRPERRTHDGNVNRKWLLTGIARCECGEGIRSGTTKERYRAYRGQCGHFQRRAEVIDNFVVDSAIAALSAPGMLEAADDSGVDVSALRTALVANDAKAARAIELWRNNIFTDAELTAEKLILDAENVAISAQIADAEKTDPLAAFVTNSDVRALWDGLSLARRQTVIRALFDAVVILPVGKGVRATSDAPRVNLEWSGEAVRRFSFETGQPYAVPKLTPEQKAEINTALNG